MKWPIITLCSFCLCINLEAQEKLPELLIAGLSSEVFQERELAQASLLQWVQEKAPAVYSEIIKLHTTTDDPEVRKRTKAILKSLSDIDYLSDGKGYVGIEMAEEALPAEDVDKAFAIRINKVVRSSPAEAAGLRRGDLIVRLDDVPWKEMGAMNDFMTKIAGMKPQREVKLKILRDGAENLDVSVVLGRRPVDNLLFIGEDLPELDRKAREDHFRKWLKMHELAL
jgi:C-terminal processing protease CtpA/Prc